MNVFIIKTYKYKQNIKFVNSKNKRDKNAETNLRGDSFFVSNFSFCRKKGFVDKFIWECLSARIDAIKVSLSFCV